MIIKKTVNLSCDIDIHIDSDDIRIILAENPDVDQWLSDMNTIAGYIKGTPDEVLIELTQKQVETIADFLIDQARSLALARLIQPWSFPK